MEPSNEIIQTCHWAYLAAVRELSLQRAERVVNAALSDGLTPEQLYLKVFQPTLIEIGDLWQHRRLTIAEEHAATAITQRLMGELSPHFRLPEAPHGRVAMLGCVADELHHVGLQMVADLMQKDGWEIIYLGQTVPTRSLLGLAARVRADVLGLSVTMPNHLGAVRALIRDAHARGPALRILVGGSALTRAPELAAQLGADGIGTDAQEGVRIANALCAPGPA